MRTDVGNAVAGSLTGFTVRTLTHPLDVVKIRFQLQVECISNDSDGYYRSLFQTVKRMLREEGFLSFWKGHIPGQLLSIIFTSSEFYCFHKLAKLSLKYLNLTPSKSEDLILGSFAGLISTVICQPADVLRTRLACQGSKKVYLGLTHGARCIMKEEGVLAFWRGLSPSIMLIVPQTAISFCVYEQLKRVFSSPIDAVTLRSTPWLSCMTPLAGCIAGCVSKTAVYPLDMLKKRLQVIGFEEARRVFGRLPTIPPSCTGTNCLHRTCLALYHIWKLEGTSGIFKGWTPSMLKAGTSTALTFSFFELYRSLLSN